MVLCGQIIMICPHLQDSYRAHIGKYNEKKLIFEYIGMEIQIKLCYNL